MTATRSRRHNSLRRFQTTFMNIALFGATGLVGSNIPRVAARRGHHTTAMARDTTTHVPSVEKTEHVDLLDPEAIHRAVLDLFPDAIINAAAVSEPAHCVADPELSRHINVALPKLLGQLANHVGARYIHFSSEQVFDGTRSPYTDDAPPSPPNLYAEQKAEAEELVLEVASEFVTTLRLPLLAGNSLSGTRSLHERLFGLWASGRKARLYSDEIRQPCTADNVAEVAVELLERNDCRGTHNWAGSESLSRAQIGQRIARHFGLPADELIETALQADDEAGAERQRDLSLDISTLSGALKTTPESFDQVLERLILPAPYRDWYRSQA